MNTCMKILFVTMHAMQQNSTNATHVMDATYATDATHLVQKMKRKHLNEIERRERN